MHSNIYLLIVISVLDGFFMRPLNMFVLNKITSLVKYANSKPLVILLFFASMFATLSITISTIFLSLKLTGFIPLGDHLLTFIISFIVGGALWVIYARKFNRTCSIDLD